MIRFKDTIAEAIQVGDIMRQVDEYKRHSEFYYYQATRVFQGDIFDPIYDADGKYIGDRIDKDVVSIEWKPLNIGRSFSRRYSRQTLIEIAQEPIKDISELIICSEHDDEI